MAKLRRGRWLARLCRATSLLSGGVQAIDLNVFQPAPLGLILVDISDFPTRVSPEKRSLAVNPLGSVAQCGQRSIDRGRGQVFRAVKLAQKTFGHRLGPLVGMVRAGGGSHVVEKFFQIGPLVDPHAAAVPVGPGRQDVADRTVLKTLDRFPIERLVASLQSDADAQILFFGFSSRGEHGSHTWRIDGHRLLHKNMLARLDRRLEMERTKTGRSS